MDGLTEYQKDVMKIHARANGDSEMFLQGVLAYVAGMEKAVHSIAQELVTLGIDPANIAYAIDMKREGNLQAWGPWEAWKDRRGLIKDFQTHHSKTR